MRLEVMGHLAMQNVADRRSGPSKQCQRRAAKHPKVAALQPRGQNVQAAVVKNIGNDYAKERGELGKEVVRGLAVRAHPCCHSVQVQGLSGNSQRAMFVEGF